MCSLVHWVIVRFIGDQFSCIGVNPVECIHVGDNPVADIDGARRIGMKTVFINRNQTIDVESDYEITSLNELTKLI